MSRIGNSLANALDALCLRREEGLVANANAHPPVAPQLPPEVFPDGEQFPVRPLEVASGRDLERTASGGPGSLLPYEKLDHQGRRFLSGARSAREVGAVTGAPAQAPFRLYAGLLHGKSAQERVSRLLQEARTLKNDRGQTALDQPVWVIAPSTGSGFVVPEGVEAAENDANGHCATFSFQYSALPSVLSVPQGDHLGTEEFRLLLNGLNAERLARLREGKPAPRIVVLGESLASQLVSQALQGHLDELERPGSLYHIDRMLLTGVPGFTKLPKEVLKPGHGVSDDGRFALLDGSKGPADWTWAPYLFADNPTDPVPRMGDLKALGEVMLHRPADWQAGVPYHRFFTGAHMVVGISAATHPPPGHLGNVGHNYSDAKAALVAFGPFDGKVPQEVVDWTHERQVQEARDRGVQLSPPAGKAG